jgi:cation:H+ antiporter
MTTTALLLAGLIGLMLGAEMLVRGSTRLARNLGMTPLLAGLVIASIGTSSPELTVSLGAALRGQGDLALGNVIGSNVANIALILGLCAVIRPISVNVQLVRVDVPVMIGVTGLGIVLLWNGMIGRIEGVMLAAALVAYLAMSVYLARRDRSMGDATTERIRRPLLNVALTIGGVGVLVLGGTLLLNGATDLARMAGMSERVIGITIVAVGTSLPELATSVLATLRGQTDVAVGNVVGSNIFNILGILGITAVASPIIAEGLSGRDLLALLATAAVMLPLVYSGFRISRLEGVILLLAYGGYVWWVIG